MFSAQVSAPQKVSRKFHGAGINPIRIQAAIAGSAGELNMLELSKEDRIVLFSIVLANAGLTLKRIAVLTELPPEVTEGSITRLEALNCIRKVSDGDPAYVASLFSDRPLLPSWDHWLTTFCQAFPQFVECDAEATTYASIGIVVLAALLADSRNAELIAHVTGFPCPFVQLVLSLADEICLWFSPRLLDLRCQLVSPAPFARIEAFLHSVNEDFWRAIPEFAHESLEHLRAGHQAGGSRDTWAEEVDIRNAA